MFVGQEIVFLHLQKAAGSTIAHTLSKYFTGREYAGHSQLRNDKNGRLIIGAIRDPLTWYTSLWSYGCDGKGGLYNSLTASTKKSGYRIIRKSILNPKCWSTTYYALQIDKERKPDFWKNLYNDAESKGNFQCWLASINNSQALASSDPEYIGLPLSKFAGYMTYRVLLLYTDYKTWQHEKYNLKTYEDIQEYYNKYCCIDRFLRVENLDVDLKSMLLQMKKINVATDIRLPKKNTSSNQPAVSYYNDATKKIVFERERLIFSTFGYDEK